MTEQEVKELMQREFGVDNVDALWDKVMESPEMKRQELLTFITSMSAATLQGFIAVAKIMALRMKNER
jgi:hypothetical protein